MTDERKKTASKFLSKHLRHSPERIGLVLESGGWVKVDDLLTACRIHHLPLTRDELEEIVATNDKQRFAFDESGYRIRASQGHSVPVDLDLPRLTPPPVLFHGTGHQSVVPIQQNGLKRMRRNHVHLSADTETATRVGARHGRPTIFTIDADQMHRDGYLFYRSENGVWLVESVPAKYLSLESPAR